MRIGFMGRTKILFDTILKFYSLKQFKIDFI